MVKYLKIRFDLDDPRDRDIYNRFKESFRKRQISNLIKNLLDLFSRSSDDCPSEKIEKYKLLIVKSETPQTEKRTIAEEENIINKTTDKTKKDIKQEQKNFLGEFATYN